MKSSMLRARYRRHRSIVTEGSTKLFRGWDTKLERAVTLRVLSSSVEDARMFERDARLIGALDHAALVPVHEVDLDHDPPFVVMGAIEGTNLRSWVRAHGPASADQSRAWVRAIAEYLCVAHERGISGHSINPTTVFVREHRAQLSAAGTTLDASGARADLRALALLGLFALTGTDAEPSATDPSATLCGRQSALAVAIVEALSGQLDSACDMVERLSAARAGEGA